MERIMVISNPKYLGEKPFPRWLVFGMGLVAPLFYLELCVLQIFRTPGVDSEMYTQFSGLSVFLLPISFVAFVMVPLMDKLNSIANRKPILVRISQNKVIAKRLDCDISHECDGDFSYKTEIVSDAAKLSETVTEAIKGCSKERKVFSIAPYIVFTASEPLSKVQRLAAEDAIKSAGALDVTYMVRCLSDAEAVQFVRQHPTSFNFA
jgi:hypothetical protein